MVQVLIRAGNNHSGFLAQIMVLRYGRLEDYDLAVGVRGIRPEERDQRQFLRESVQAS